MTDDLRRMIIDLEPPCLRAKTGARFLVNCLLDAEPGPECDLSGAIFVAERLEEIVEEIAERRSAIHTSACRAPSPPERRAPIALVHDRDSPT